MSNGLYKCEDCGAICEQSKSHVCPIASAFKSVRVEPYTREQEEQQTLALIPIAQEITDFVHARIPAGTDFGVLLFAKPLVGETKGRVIAITSDRERVAFYAAQWVLSVVDPTARTDLKTTPEDG